MSIKKMRIVSLNVNGLRAAAKKGLFSWLVESNPDVLCLQEVKAQDHQLEGAVFHPAGYQVVFVNAVRPGYSGVAIYAKSIPDKILTSFGLSLSDEEGRFVEVQYGTLSIISVYFPSGTTGEARQAQKYIFLKAFGDYLSALKKRKRSCIICGDWNIAHKPIDLKNWRANQTHTGFLPEERAWLDWVFSELGYVDAFRYKDDRPDQYTWWSHRGQAWAKNVGWRIDYQVVSPDVAPCIESVAIYKGQRFSDHAPLIIDYRLND